MGNYKTNRKINMGKQASSDVHISYIRLVLMIASWYFVMDSPEVYLGIMAFETLLHVIQ